MAALYVSNSASCLCTMHTYLLLTGKSVQSKVVSENQVNIPEAALQINVQVFIDEIIFAVWRIR